MKASNIGFVSFLVLAGCTPARLVSANPSSVIVIRNRGLAEAAAVAEAKCASYGKDARLAHTQGDIMSFDCVTRDAPVR